MRTEDRKSIWARVPIWVYAVMVLTMIAGFGVAAIFLPRLTAGPVGKTQQIVAVNVGNYRIANFDQFHDVYGDIKDRENRLAIVYAEPPTGTRDITACKGLLSSYLILVEDYNAAARATETRGQWRDPELPSNIIPIGGNPCTGS